MCNIKVCHLSGKSGDLGEEIMVSLHGEQLGERRAGLAVQEENPRPGDEGKRASEVDNKVANR